MIFKPLGNIRSQVLQHLLNIGLPLRGWEISHLRVNIDQEGFLGLGLLLEPVLDLVEVDLLSLLKVLMHPIFSRDIA